MSETTQQPVLRSRSALPSGRAILGALLITLAALGVLLASRLGDDATFQDVIVATEDLAPGTVIAEGDVATVRLRLDEQADFVVGDITEVVGNVTLGPIGRLEFVQRSNIAEGLPNAVPSGLAEVSISVEPSDAPPFVATGELVSILASYDDADGIRTELVADRVIVLSYGTDSDEIGLNQTVLRLGVQDGGVGTAIVNAAQEAVISVVGISSGPEVILPEETTR